jgi:hypothetical protein
MELVHDTLKRLSVAFSLGTDTIDHADPFQDSMRIWDARQPSIGGHSWVCPTALQSVVLVQDTLLRKLVLPLVAGLESIDHADPFQDSIRFSIWFDGSWW